MAIFHFRWRGHITSTNEWTKIRIVPNKYWKPGMPESRRFIPLVYQTAKYKDFKTSLADSMRGVKISGYLDLMIHVSMHKIRDTDNPLKPVMDALEQSGVIKNDKFIRDIKVVRGYHAKGEPDILIIDLYRIKYRDCSWAGDKELQFYGEKNDQENKNITKNID